MSFITILALLTYFSMLLNSIGKTFNRILCKLFVFNNIQCLNGNLYLYYMLYFFTGIGGFENRTMLLSFQEKGQSKKAIVKDMSFNSVYHCYKKNSEWRTNEVERKVKKSIISVTWLNYNLIPLMRTINHFHSRTTIEELIRFYQPKIKTMPKIITYTENIMSIDEEGLPSFKKVNRTIFVTDRLQNLYE